MQVQHRAIYMIVNIALLSLIVASITLNREVIASHGFEIEFDEKLLERTTGQTTQLAFYR